MGSSLSMLAEYVETQQYGICCMQQYLIQGKMEHKYGRIRVKYELLAVRTLFIFIIFSVGFSRPSIPLQCRIVA